MEFNTSMNIIAADVRTCLRPHTNSSSTNSLTIHYDYGHVALSFNFDSLSTPITKDCRAQLKEIVDALNFNDILDLKRWTDIKDLTNRSQIDWDATWGLFNYHISAKKSTTSFKHSSKVVFASAREAIQNHEQELDCFGAEPVIGPRSARTRWRLAMTIWDTPPHSRGGFSPEGCKETVRLKRKKTKRGRRESRVPTAPVAPYAITRTGKKKRHRSRPDIGFPAQWF